jgi:hypothetical protein
MKNNITQTKIGREETAWETKTQMEDNVSEESKIS